MKNHFLGLLLITLLALTSHAQDEDTVITFYIEHTVEPQQDYLAIVVTIKEQQASLKEALANSELKVAEVRGLIQDHCKANSKKKGQCIEITQSGKFNVQPYYRVIRGQYVFVAFEVTYEVTGKIIHTDNVGPLVDKINKKSGTNIPSLEWQAFEEGEHDIETVSQGLEQAEARCAAIGMNVGQIESIEEVANFQLDQEPAQQGEEQEQEEQEQEEVITYKFVMKCVRAKPTKKAEPKKAAKTK